MTEWKSFDIFMPDKLIPIHEFLQSELTAILSDEALREKLEVINLSQHRGNIWTEIKNSFLKERVKQPQWQRLHNKAWHANILAENLRRELESKRERIEIFKLLEKYNFEITTQLREELNAAGLYPTRGHLENLIDSRKMPTVAYDASFILDYSVSEKQFFGVSENDPHQFRIKVGKTAWIDYKVEAPFIDNLGRIAKPRFFKRNGRYIGSCSYEYQPEEAPEPKAVLGVDLGKVKTYSAVAITEDGEVLGEFLPSRQLERINDKIDVLYKEKEHLLKKTKHHEKLGVPSPARLLEQVEGVSGKISRNKVARAELAAVEIVHLAKETSSPEIGVEDLRWLKSKGGSWEHSLIQTAIEEEAKQTSIKVTKVPAAYTSTKHPITKERGKERGRDVIYSDGTEYDRDFIGAANVASELKVYEIKELRPKKPKRIKRKITNNKRKRTSRQQKGAGVVVPVSPSSVLLPLTAKANGKTPRSTKMVVVESHSSLLSRYYRE